MSTFELFTILQTAVMAVVTIVVWALRQTTKRAQVDHDGDRRLTLVEADLTRLRDQQQGIMAWQQHLLLELDDRYYTRREVIAREGTEATRRERKRRGDAE